MASRQMFVECFDSEVENNIEISLLLLNDAETVDENL